MAFAPYVLNEEALRALPLEARETVNVIERALRDVVEGNLHVTPKSVITPGDGRYVMSTLASGAMSVAKVVTVSPDNPSRGLPSITGAIMILDAQTGECLALMDAELITALRTAGLSALAALSLADPETKVMSFVGAGVQARAHLDLFCDLFDLQEILISGRGQANMDALGDLAREKGLCARICDAPQEALRADIVVTSIPITYSGAAFLDAREMAPNALAIVTDAAKPWIREGRGAFGTVIVDDLEQEAAMPDPVVAPERMSGDLAGLISGKVTAGAGPRAFMFRGLGAGDYALAVHLWGKCQSTSNNV